LTESVTATEAERRDRNTRLREVATLFLKLGVIAFGGPAAHIAMMEDEFVSKREWITREDFSTVWAPPI
jgi:chromate transporter